MHGHSPLLYSMGRLTSSSSYSIHTVSSLFTSVFISPSIYRVLPRYLNSVTYGSWTDCVFLMAFHSNTLTLTLQLTLSFLFSMKLPSIVPVPTPACIYPLRTAPHHPRTSSANKCFFSDTFHQWLHHDGKEERASWKRILGGVQLPRQMVRLFLQHTSLQFRSDGACPLPVWCTSLVPLVSHAPILFFPWDSVYYINVTRTEILF